MSVVSVYAIFANSEEAQRIARQVVEERLAAHEVSVARLIQHQINGSAGLHIVTHEARWGAVEATIAALTDVSASSSGGSTRRTGATRPAGRGRTSRR